MPGKLQVVEATPDLARSVIQNMSDYAAEDYVSTETDWDRVAYELQVSTICHVALWEGEPAAMWGVRPHSMFSGAGYMWLSTTKVVEEHPFLFVRYARIVCDRLLQLFPTLHGIVLPHDMRNVRWLRLMGFTVGQPEMIHGKRYRRFVRRRDA